MGLAWRGNRWGASGEYFLRYLEPPNSIIVQNLNLTSNLFKSMYFYYYPLLAPLWARPIYIAKSGSNNNIFKLPRANPKI